MHAFPCYMCVCMSRFYVTPAFFSTKHENCRTFFNSSLHWHEGLLMRITIPASDPPIDLSEDRTKTNISHFIKPVSLSSFLRRDWSGHFFFSPSRRSRVQNLSPSRRPATREESASVISFFAQIISFSVMGSHGGSAAPPPRVALWRVISPTQRSLTSVTKGI